ncbi:factor of DNA methylation 5 [Beta vulgaris subsp. vulgaris]|uniref:factor of DNA methylation 5 n=1 Tax=Beta vulgaris subsp. vulgaris TaxID=3555 RepID=UPI002036F9FA|nr:factor of DNA methylation 5 [Beta vulgaris subsp. vulgaris]
MADNNHEELNHLRGLVMNLANEIDYKNHLLMEKEGLSLEKFATMSSLIEEKDRLLDEKSAVIGSLMAQKHRLHEVYVEESRKCEQVKQEMKNIRLELKDQQQKVETRIKGQEELQALNDKGLGTVTTNSVNANRCLESPEINLIVPVNQSSELFSKHDKAQKSQEKLQYLTARNEDLKVQLKSMMTRLSEKEALHQLESPNQTLESNKDTSNEELRSARTEAINCFLTMDGDGTLIGIKRFGEIDRRPFQDVCSKFFGNRNWEEKFNELFSLWQENVNDPSWNPFKKEINRGKLSEVIDDNDKKLAELREEWGEEAYKAVVNALLDSRKFDPRTNSSNPELWNFEEGRRADLKEVIQYIIQRCDVYKNKYNEQTGAIIELIAEKEKLLGNLESINVILEEKDKLLKEKYEAVAKLTTRDMEKDKLLSKSSATISTLMAEKHLLLESCNAEKRKSQCLKEQIEKLKHVLQPQEELAKPIEVEEHKKTKHNYGGDRSVAIKDKGVNWYMDSLTDQKGPIAKKLKDSKVHSTKEEISSTSNNIKLQGQNTGEMLKHPKAEPDTVEEPPNGRLDLLGLSQPSTHSYLLPPKAVISATSYSMVLETTAVI